MAKKNQDGQGTYYRSGDYYCWKIRIGSREARTSIVRRAATAGELKKLVRIALNEIAKNGDRVPKGTEVTVKQKLQQWLDVRIKPNREATTYNKYESLIRVHIVPVLGKMKVTAVDYLAMQALVNHILATIRTRKDGSPMTHKDGSPWLLSGDTAISAVSCLCTGLGVSIQAMKRAGLELPDAKARDRVLSVEEIALFLDEAYAMDSVKSRPSEAPRPRWRDGILLGFVLNTGVRINEALGIVIPMLNLRENTCEIARQLKRSTTKKGATVWKLGPTKSKAVRTLPLNEAAIALVRRQLQVISQDKEIAGEAYEDNALLFATGSGRPHSERNCLRSLESILEAAGVEHCTVHDLRRSYITHLAAIEPNISTVAKLAGHSNIATTSRHYVIAQARVMEVTANKLSFGVRKQA